MGKSVDMDKNNITYIQKYNYGCKNFESIINDSLNKLDFKRIKVFGDYNILEKDYRWKRDQEFPFTEIPSFIKETIGPDISDTTLVNAYIPYARVAFLQKTDFHEDTMCRQLLSNEKAVKVEERLEGLQYWCEQLHRPFLNFQVHSEPLSIYTNNTSLSNTIQKLLELPEDSLLRNDFEDLLVPGLSQQLIKFVFNQVALDFPLDYLDLVMRLVFHLELLPGTFNFFLFSSLYDLIIDLNLDEGDDGAANTLADFVSDLKAYAKSEEIRDFMDEKKKGLNPKLQQILNKGLGNDTVINQALDLSNLTARCYHFMDIDEEMEDA